MQHSKPVRKYGPISNAFSLLLLPKLSARVRKKSKLSASDKADSEVNIEECSSVAFLGSSCIGRYKGWKKK